MTDYPATGKWAIYSVQKTLPVLGQVGALLDKVHNYLVLVGPDGKVIKEMQGVHSGYFTIGDTLENNFLQVRMYEENGHMSEQSVLNRTLVTSGAESLITSLFDNAFDAVADALNKTHDLYQGASLFSSNTYNSNSVWYTAMKAMGVADPSQYVGSYTGAPGDSLDLRVAPSNNPNSGSIKFLNPPKSKIFFNEAGDRSNPDNGSSVVQFDSKDEYAWADETSIFDDIGNAISKLVNGDDQTSSLTLYDPTSSISSEMRYYLGLDGTGTNIKNIINLKNGLTLQEDFGTSANLYGVLGTESVFGANGSLLSKSPVFSGSELRSIDVNGFLTLGRRGF